MSYVVTGATGQIGSALVDYLLSQSVPVRVFIRSENKAKDFRSRNVEVVIGNLDDVEALTKGFQGAKGVFAMNPPAYETPNMQAAAASIGHALASVIKAAKVERVVVLSSIGSERSSKTGSILTTHTLEKILKESAPQVVMLRCGGFIENWLNSISAVKSGESPVLGSMFQKLDRKLPHVATNDIARIAAQYLTKPKGELDKLTIIELEGPEDFSPNDVANLVSQILGKNVPAVPITAEMARGMFQKFGWTKANIDGWIEMVQGFDDGTICWTTDQNVIRIKGNVTLKQVIEKHFK
jgi:uncharacterized protein YbjT (DUF2867 family)